MNGKHSAWALGRFDMAAGFLLARATYATLSVVAFRRRL
jgi:hypothetical protein